MAERRRDGTLAVLVAHGAPSAPDGPEARMRALARAVGLRLPGWRVHGTTLAMPGGLDRALAGGGPAMVYPLFMADGWFVRREIPRRLAAAGRDGATVLDPYGLDPAVRRLALSRVRDAIATRGWVPSDTAVLVAAHGSLKSTRPAAAANAAAALIAATGGFREVRTGFVDEAPFIADAARGLGRAVCLPFFALTAGHVEDDVPEALAEAGFDGPLLTPLGEDPETPAIVARALARALPACTAGPAAAIA